ncbi:MAG: phosphatidylserine decarboxylase [Verrucomicrobia bacterium]|nr:phosphatidylserine decarboxylase [Verrucomicrobiota bacterium]
MIAIEHQYVERSTGAIRTEQLVADGFIRWLYAREREEPGRLMRALTSRRFTRLLGALRYDLYLGNRRTCGLTLLRQLGADPAECLDDPQTLDSPRKVFERRIRYWEVRPLPGPETVVVSPADSRVLLVSLDPDSLLFLKEKFFTLDELLGPAAGPWRERFHHADGAVFRLTPDKYHYNHLPVSGRVVAFYEIEGACHSCNPFALVRAAGLHAKNRRAITVIDTDVPGGSRAGLVIMVEVVALMIGEVVQCYSDERYDHPRPVEAGMFLRRGAPKSLFRPGSSTVVLLFERGRVAFDPDLTRNQARVDVQSRFSAAFGHPQVETDLAVRSSLGLARPPRRIALPGRPAPFREASPVGEAVAHVPRSSLETVLQPIGHE